MSDPRYTYKGTVFTNTRGRNEDKAVARRQASLENNPTSHGWEWSYWNDEFGQVVYTQGNAKLMYNLGYWIVQIGDGFAKPYEGDIKKVTEQALKETSK